MSDRFETTWWAYTGKYTPFNENGHSSPIMRNLTTGEERPSGKLPFGALYDENVDPRDPTKRSKYAGRGGSDGCNVVCVCPTTSPPRKGEAGRWYVDSRASNCTKRDDDVHRCWVRHGTVGERLTADKAGNTCAAGAGSIQMAGWHGFLKNGVLHT